MRGAIRQVRRTIGRRTRFKVLMDSPEDRGEDQRIIEARGAKNIALTGILWACLLFLHFTPREILSNSLGNSFFYGDLSKGSV